MKNKRARQMMIDCGNMDLAIMMMQIEIGTKCHSLKRSGSYSPMTDMIRITEDALYKRKHLFKCDIVEAPKPNPHITGGNMISLDLIY
jgi:hypothetical protein